MAFFGSGTKTTTKVTPAKQTEDLLKDIVNMSNGYDNQSYINHEMAGMSQDQRGALAQLAASPELQRAAGLLQGQTSVGLDNLNSSNSAYQNSLSNPVTAQQVNDFRNAMTGAGSLSSRTVGQGTNAAGAVSALGNSAALRSAGRFNAGNIQATQQNARSQQMGDLGVSNLIGNQGYAQDVARLQGNMGQANVNLGGQGVSLGQQALQNQLSAGDFTQQFENAQNQNTWQNQLGQQQFDWNQLNNKLNVLNSVSPMAGYTATNYASAPSVGSQLFGAGLTTLGTVGKLGGFSGFGSKTGGGEYKNQLWNNGGTGALNSAVNWFGGSK